MNIKPSGELGKKLKSIRVSEGISQSVLSDLTGISISTIKKYEAGIIEPGGVTLRRFTTHQSFKKYTLWLMSDDTSEAAGQVAPSLNFYEGDTNEH
ncbi:TPA: helix-turn-helix domain-containing protein [Klebsiella pneumoniae]